MNYYIQGNKEKADQIKAAFEKLGYDVTGFDMRNDNILFFTYKLQTGANVISTTNAHLYTANIIKTHQDYTELELPKTHYDISNFQQFQKVLVRHDDSCTWGASFFGRYAGMFMCCNNACFIQCIPFEGNEHLLGTTEPCDEQYINW